MTSTKIQIVLHVEASYESRESDTTKIPCHSFATTTSTTEYGPFKVVAGVVSLTNHHHDICEKRTYTAAAVTHWIQL